MNDVSALNFILSFAAALVAHELGHLVAARLCRISITEAGLGWGPAVFSSRVRSMNYKLRLLPLGAYIRMDMVTLQRRTLGQQLFVLLAGIMVNLVLGTLALGTFFGTINLALALGNLFPLYQQDGWKAGMVISRRIFNRPVPVIEWSFTIAAGISALGLAALLFSIL
ncbi:MAG: site-2 protease family protein [Acidobacteriota bacterium]|nr:site-2 protease family protein [Acidobacteriota bacterium]